MHFANDLSQILLLFFGRAHYRINYNGDFGYGSHDDILLLQLWMQDWQYFNNGNNSTIPWPTNNPAPAPKSVHEGWEFLNVWVIIIMLSDAKIDN